MNFDILEKSSGTKFMFKNDFFQSSEMKNELFKIQTRKPNFIQSIQMKTII